jgi:hypothetical protein
MLISHHSHPSHASHPMADFPITISSFPPNPLSLTLSQTMANHHELANFIWQIADLLRGIRCSPQNECVVLPLTILRAALIAGSGTGRINVTQT